MLFHYKKESKEALPLSNTKKQKVPTRETTMHYNPHQNSPHDHHDRGTRVPWKLPLVP